jgi:hypothetical protein
MHLSQEKSERDFMDILAIGITSAKEFEEKRILYKFPIE